MDREIEPQKETKARKTKVPEVVVIAESRIELDELKGSLQSILTVSTLIKDLNIINKRIKQASTRCASPEYGEEFRQLLDGWTNTKHLALLGALHWRASGWKGILIGQLLSTAPFDVGENFGERLVFRITDKRQTLFTNTARANITRIVGEDRLAELIGNYDTFELPQSRKSPQ